MGKHTRFIAIMSDYGFKLTFANESNTLFLKRALQALIQTEEAITNIRFLRNEFIGITPEARAGLYDLICEDEKQRSFIVEMQVGPYPTHIQRAKFYAFHRFNTLGI